MDQSEVSAHLAGSRGLSKRPLNFNFQECSNERQMYRMQIILVEKYKWTWTWNDPVGLIATSLPQIVHLKTPME